MDFKDWMRTNPSGYDHHDPQNTIDDFGDWMDEVVSDVKRDFHLK